MNEAETYQIRVLHTIADVDATTWDNLAKVKRSDGSIEDNPFVSHAYLNALEQSGSATGKTGWYGQHLILENNTGKALGALICYLKTHSQGEYIFDHIWADAFYRAGGEYYPKLQASVPFTPATGPRFLTGSADNPDPIQAALLSGIQQLSAKVNASSAHITFMREQEWNSAGTHEFLQRTDRQFHWHNQDYKSFDDFLASLASRKRKNIRKERNTALSDSDLSIEHLRGDELTPEAWDAFFEFYMDTGSRKWGQPYLTRAFYTLIDQTMADKILLIMVKRGERYIAGAINFIGDDCLYGRHWGCVEDHPCLHFEVCYYQAIEFAIQHNLKRVEAGAQGEHKLARGYAPVTTYSAHHIVNRSFKNAIEDYLENERQHVQMEKDILSNHLPFRKG